MRDIYHDELDDIGKRVIEMTHLVAIAMERATQALLDANLSLADQVIADDRRIDALRTELEDRTFQVIAQQQPVATDLRVLISTIHLAADLERMGDLAHHVAKIARLRYPEIAVPPEARDVISQMGEVAASLVQKVADVVDGRDIALAAGDRAGRRLDGCLAPQAVHARAVAELGARHRGGDRHDAARSLLRALRRPRGGGRAAHDLHRHGQAAERRG